MRLVASIVAATLALSAGAQQFGGNPASIRWRLLSSPAVRVLYPQGMDSAAARVATVSNYLQQRHAGTIGTAIQPISIVLQPDVNYSNAYVGLGPWRSEFYMMPPQNPFELGANRWTDNLAIHEFRHVQQFSNYNRGLSRAMGAIFGQNGRALANAMSVPDWFFEGDAVWYETVHSAQGRGRLPAQMATWRSVLAEGRRYSYAKMRNGSLRQYVPNHYDLGYLLVSYGRQRFGDSIWRRVTQDAAAYKQLFYPLQGALKRHTGLRLSELVAATMSDFEQRWPRSESAAPQWLTAVSHRRVINYKYPYPAQDGSTVLLKTADNQIPIFIKRLASGQEQRIAVKDIGYDDYFSYRNGRIVYAALQPDTRWGNRDYSVLRLLDVATGQTHQVSTRSRLFSPDISDDGQRLVAVQLEPRRASLLQVLNTEGQVLHSFTADSSLVYSHPKFLPGDQQVLAAARQPNGHMGWLVWNSNTGASRWLLPPASRLVGFPVVLGDTVYYTATEAGFDGLYAQQIGTGQRWQLAQFATGIYGGYVQQGQVVASYFTAGGYRLGQSSALAVPVPASAVGLSSLYAIDSSRYTDLSTLPNESFNSSRFRKATGLFNFHSWQPELNEPDYTMRLYGNNVINTTQTDLFYTYNTNETSHSTGFNFAYGGWYLQPIAGVKQTWSRDVVYNDDTTFIYNETEAYAGLSLPLNLSGGRQFRFLTLTTSLHADHVRWQGIGKQLLRNLDFTYFRARLSYTGQIQRARQHIFPRWAQAVFADYRSMVSQQQAWQLLLSGSLYLPGLARNHNVVLTAAWQARDTLRQYAFSNSFPFSRGYSSVNFPRMWRLGVNYHLPLLYPEWGFGQMLYLLRIRGNAFYDYTQVKSLRTGLTRPFSTVGAELFFDTRVWNQLPVSFGIRYSRLLDTELGIVTRPNQWEFILPVNLF